MHAWLVLALYIICFCRTTNGGLTESGDGEEIESGMKGFTQTHSAEDPRPETRALRFTHSLGMVVSSLLLGMIALVVSFLAAEVYESQGTTSLGELIAPCVATALYLAFCQFWVAPRSSGFLAKLPTVIASVVPLIVFVKFTSWIHGVPWGLISGCVGSVLGAMLVQRVTAAPRPGTQSADSMNRDRNCRRCLKVSFVLLIAVALLIPLGVIPSVVTDTTPGFNAGSAGVFLGMTVAFDLLAAGLLAFAVWHRRDDNLLSKGTLGITAFVALFIALVYALTSGVGNERPALRSVLLLLCAVFGAATTVLMIVTSVIVDRARLARRDLATS